MGRYARFAGAAAMLMVAACDYLPQWTPPEQSLLVCNGDFAQFANGFLVTRPMELDFAVYWTIPAIYPLNGGKGPAQILALNGLELSFEVQYEGYRAAYRLDRVTGTFSQRPNTGRPNLGGVYFGNCHLQPLAARI